MANLIYHDHTIVSSTVYDEITGKWKLSAYVSWLEGVSPTRHLHLGSGQKTIIDIRRLRGAKTYSQRMYGIERTRRRS